MGGVGEEQEGGEGSERERGGARPPLMASMRSRLSFHKGEGDCRMSSGEGEVKPWWRRL
jgi:hypothetical protein